MSTAFECREHGVSIASVPAYVEGDAWVDAIAAQHEHAASEKWRISRNDDGWWVANRGQHEAACFTWEQAHLHRISVTLFELAADGWHLTAAPGEIRLQEIGDPLTRIFRTVGANAAATQALVFLQGALADRARRHELTTARHRAAAELDVLTDHFARDALLPAQTAAVL